MKLAVMAVVLGVAANPATAEVLPCQDIDRSSFLEIMNKATDGSILDVVGPVTLVRPGVCDMEVLMTDGFHEIQFELVTVQGKQYFHAIRQRLAGGDWVDHP
jgi:hypothetical protein